MTATPTVTTDTPAARLRRWLAIHDACDKGLDWLPADATPEQAWATAPSEYLVWAATRPGVLDDGTLWRFSRWCASQVLHLWDAPPVVRQYLETGDESLRAAARDAAWDAAWDAARAAARDVAWAAARDAAWDAARDVAWAAARDAAWDAQAAWLREHATPDWSVLDSKED